jgi:hypothetical protein
VLADVLGNNLPVLGVGVGQNILDEVVAVLVTRNVDQGNARTVKATLADAVKVTTKEINTANLEAFLDHLGGELIHAILGGIADDMVNCPAAISWGTVLANVLDAPVSKLAMGNNVNASKHLFDARALGIC